MKNRREFLAAVGALGAASTFAGSVASHAGPAAEGEKLAIDEVQVEGKSPMSYEEFKNGYLK